MREKKKMLKALLKTCNKNIIKYEIDWRLRNKNKAIYIRITLFMQKVINSTSENVYRYWQYKIDSDWK